MARKKRESSKRPPTRASGPCESAPRYAPARSRAGMNPIRVNLVVERWRGVCFIVRA